MYYIWVLALPAWLFPEADEPIATDRPDFTESASTVPLGRWQLESGGTFERGTRGRSSSGPEMLLRYGHASEWELRIGAPSFSSIRDGSTRSQGWGDVSVGVKRSFRPGANGVNAAVILATFLPTGEGEFGANRAEPEAKFCVAKDLDARTTLSGMAAIAWPADGPPVWQGTLSLGSALSEHSGIFVEYAGSFVRRAAPEHVWHAGYVFQGSRDDQWDVHFGAAFQSAPRRFFGIGYAVRR